MNIARNRTALLTIAMGFWLVALPFTFGYQNHPVEISDMICGFLLVVLGLFSLAPKRACSGWAIGLVGVWLQMSPLVFWAPSALMYVNDTLVGLIVIIFSFSLSKQSDTNITEGRPTGWSYNPSDWGYRIPTVALAILSWFFSRYMAAFQLGYIDQIWDPFFTNGTWEVITSKISKDFPVSDAGLGALCYTLESILGWQGDTRRWATMPWLVCGFGFLVIPVSVISITLIILQPVAVGAWCSWCLATAVCMLLMILLTAGELAAVLQFLYEVKQRGESVWHVFWKGGKPLDFSLETKPRYRPFKSSLGVTFPWNLITGSVLGIWLMVSPSMLNLQGSLAIVNFIEGPMIVTFSVIACAEVFRSLRYLNILFGLGLILAPWFFPSSFAGTLNNIILGVLVFLLAFRKGKISERYGLWEKLIV